MKKFTVELNQSYIELLGDVFTGHYGEPHKPPVRDFIETVHNNVLSTPVFNEFESGWRNLVKVDFTEEELRKFTSVCSNMYLSDDLELEDFRYLVQPIQMSTVQEYWDSHIEALENSPVRYRQVQAENLSPLIEACDGFFDVSEILELLLQGVLDNMSPFGKHNRLCNVTDELQSRIVNNEDEIDLSNGYFYQGPRRLGIIQTGKSKMIARCVCEYHRGYLFPFFISDSDPVSSNIREAVEMLIESDDGVH